MKKSEDQELVPNIIWSLLVIGIGILTVLAGITIENEYDIIQKQVTQTID